MHNLGLDEVFFATQFVKDLKMELRAGVQSQAPDTVKRLWCLLKFSNSYRKVKSLLSPNPTLLSNLQWLCLNLIADLLPPLVPYGRNSSSETTIKLMVCACTMGISLISPCHYLYQTTKGPGSCFGHQWFGSNFVWRGPYSFGSERFFTGGIWATFSQCPGRYCLWWGPAN